MGLRNLSKLSKVTDLQIHRDEASSSVISKTLMVSVSSVQSLSHVQLFATPWTAARQASLSITNSWSLLKLMSIESVMPPNHLILYHPLLLLPAIFPSLRVFSNELSLHFLGGSSPWSHKDLDKTE